MVSAQFILKSLFQNVIDVTHNSEFQESHLKKRVGTQCIYYSIISIMSCKTFYSYILFVSNMIFKVSMVTSSVDRLIHESLVDWVYIGIHESKKEATFDSFLGDRKLLGV